MSQMIATGKGPIRVFLPTDGKQLLIPLSAIIFDDSHTPNPYAPGYTQDEVADRLEHLAKTGALRPLEAAPKTVAMVLQSALPGSWGNAAQVTITYNADKSLFSVEVNVTKTYTDLTPATIVSVLGLGVTEALGPSPGLAHVKAGAAPAMPKASTVAFTLGSSSVLASANILTAADAPAFTLEAWKLGSSGNKTTATISDVTAQSFTLQVVWTHIKTNLSPVPANLSTTLSTINSEFGHVLTASAPPVGSLAAPQPGTVPLGGGIDFAPAQVPLISL